VWEERLRKCELTNTLTRDMNDVTKSNKAVDPYNNVSITNANTSDDIPS